MHITVQHSDLARALGIVAPFIAKRTPQDVLTHVLLDGSGDELIIAADDGRCKARLVIPAVVHDPGAATVPAEMLREFVSAAHTADEVSLTSLDTHVGLVVRAGKQSAKLYGMALEDFPALTYLEQTSLPLAVMPTAAFRAIAKRVLVAAATGDEMKANPQHEAVFIDFAGEQMDMVAVCMTRLAAYRAAVGPREVDLSLFVPARDLKLAIDALPADGDVTLSTNTRRSCFVVEAEQLTIVVPLMDMENVHAANASALGGKFANYEPFFALQPTTTVVAKISDLKDAVRIATIFAADKTNIFMRFIQLDIDENGEIRVSREGFNIGEGVGVAQGVISGSPVHMIINGRVLLDFLNVIGTERVRLLHMGANKPLVLRMEEGDQYNCVLPPYMPQQQNA